MSMAALRSRLHEVRRDAHRVYVARGILILVITAAAGAVATFLLDYSIPHLPAGVRLILLAGLLGAVGTAGWKYLLRPLRLPLTDDDLALLVEEAYPQLGDRLISTLQLVRVREENPGFNSPALIDVLARETFQVAHGLDFRPVVRHQGLKKLGAWTLGAAVLLGAYGLSYPDLAGIWFRRLLGGATPWPKQTHLRLVGAEAVVAKGDNYAVRVEADGKVPSKARIFYRFGDGGGFETDRMTADGEAFRYDFLRVAEDFTFYVEAGDDSTERLAVRALAPPRVERLSVWLAFPPYTGQEGTPVDRPLGAGPLRIPVGTEVRVRAETDVPLAAGQLRLGRQGREEVVASAVGEDGCSLEGTFTVLADTEYSVFFRGMNGLTNERTMPRHSVRAIQDEGPTIKVLAPGRDTQAVADGLFPIEVLTTDDYGVASVELVWRLAHVEGQEARRIVFDIGRNSAPYGAEKIVTKAALETKQFGASVGETVLYRFEATDAFDRPEPHRTVSREYRLALRTQEELERAVEDRIMKLKEEVRAARDLQRAVVGRTKDVAERVAGADEVERAEREALRSLVTQQRQVGTRIQRLAEEAASIASEVENNRLWDEAARKRLQSIREILESSAGETVPEAARQVGAALAERHDAPRQAALKQAAETGGAVEAEMEDVLRRMQEWEDYQEVLRIVRQLLKRQKGVTEGLRRVGK